MHLIRLDTEKKVDTQKVGGGILDISKAHLGRRVGVRGWLNGVALPIKPPHTC